MYIIPVYILYYWIIVKYFNLFLYRKNIALFKKAGILFIIFLFQAIVLKKLDNVIFIFCSNLLILFLISFILYYSSVMRNIILSMLGGIAGMTAEIITVASMKLSPTSSSATLFAANIISKILLLMIVHIASLIVNKKSYTEISWKLCLLLISTSISSFLILHCSYVIYQTTGSRIEKILSTTIILFISLINIAYYIIEDRLSFASLLFTKNCILNKELDHYSKLFTSSQRRDDALLRARHDFKNQLIGLRAYALQSNNATIIEYINSILAENGPIFKNPQYCENVVIDMLLSAKNELAEQHNIKYSVDAIVPPEIPFESIDLCTLIGNALDNCFDACMHNTIKNPFVDIQIRHYPGCLYISLSNPYTNSLTLNSADNYITTKSHSTLHGYGLQAIKRIVAKYNGQIKFETENQIFVLKTMLYYT